MNLSLFLSAATSGPASFLSPSNPLFMMGIMFAIFYFLLIAPMRKKQKKHAAMLQNLKNGDRIITNGGIHGTVVGVEEGMIQVRIADQVKIDVSKSAISAFQNPEE